MIEFRRIYVTSQFELALESGLYQTFHQCFSGSPFYENFTPEQVKNQFEVYLDSGFLCIAKQANKTIGFIATVPLIYTKEMGDFSFLNTWAYTNNSKFLFTAKFLTDSYQINTDKVQYVSYLGVADAYRCKGIASQLFGILFSNFEPSTGYMLRTTRSSTASYIVNFYQKLGFQILPFYQKLQVENKGSSIENERLIGLKFPQYNQLKI
ncbi:GNAT family N-acetyltransferase [Laspinema olomoucense]|uniref:GNAT family N-acetyltransferase n=1 Tax=Laspinema olomoucense TaxID=3231600 RepID=UPI0021BB014F|nr:GNAT family N-acetyltransferase [Laspinema sp. D3c]MCT7997190.1 GNAT family N-acetyltransferase [Laspinema sp. D3c]